MKYLIIALGNTGDRYARTRHNIGWIVCDELLPDAHWVYDKYADADIFIDGDCIYAKPQTMMNRSGYSTEILAKKHEILSQNIIVLHDDLDIPIGSFKIAIGRGDAGNNGVKSIHASLGTRNITRIRIGIMQSHNGKPIKPPVLGEFNKDERALIPVLSDNIKKALRLIVEGRHEEAMNAFH